MFRTKLILNRLKTGAMVASGFAMLVSALMVVLEIVLAEEVVFRENYQACVFIFLSICLYSYYADRVWDDYFDEAIFADLMTSFTYLVFLLGSTFFIIAVVVIGDLLRLNLI